MILLLILSALLSTPRSSTVRRQFQRLHPCPATGSTRGPCPGYVVDHLVALRCGGRDAVENMRWEPVLSRPGGNNDDAICRGCAASTA